MLEMSGLLSRESLLSRETRGWTPPVRKRAGIDSPLRRGGPYVPIPSLALRISIAAGMGPNRLLLVGSIERSFDHRASYTRSSGPAESQER
jgi:hypothetical protein